jgi:nitric oxide reductase large subunit
MKNFLAELKRRNVHKGAIVYAVIAWLLIQVAFIPEFEVPSWAIKTLIVLLALGFVAVVSISWAFEATPEGMKRTEELSPNEVLPTWSRKKFAIFIITTALLAAGLLVFDLLQRKPPTLPPATATGD